MWDTVTFHSEIVTFPPLLITRVNVELVERR